MAKKITTATAAEVRAWAQENGHTVGQRGRFSASLVEAFNKAHKRAGKVYGAPAEVSTEA